jgi:hypothetical protein
MALTTYDGLTPPVVPFIDDTTFGNSDVTTVGAASAGVVSMPYGILEKNDYLLLQVVMHSVTATVSAIGFEDLGIDSFTKIADVVSGSCHMQLWIARLDTDVLEPSDLTYTITETVEVTANLVPIRNATSYVVGTPATATSVTVTINYPEIDCQNGMMMYAMGCMFTGVPLNYTDIGGIAWDGPIGMPMDDPSAVLDAENDPVQGEIGICMSQIGAGISPVQTLIYDSDMVRWASVGILFRGPTVDLDDNTLMITEDGPLLNGPLTEDLLVYDLNSIDGLDDITATLNSDPVDGADGSTVDAKYRSGKTINIDGTILTGIMPLQQTVIDDLKRACAPSESGVPCIYKPVGLDLKPRYLLVKPVSCKALIDRTRSMGQTAFQVQLMTEDTVAYQQLLSVKSGLPIADPSGGYSCYVDVDMTDSEVDTYPVLYFNYYPASDGIITDWLFWNVLRTNIPNTINQLTLNDTTDHVLTARCAMRLDLKNRVLETTADALSWTNVSSLISGHDWFSLIPGRLNRIKFNRGSAREGFTLVYAKGTD